MNFQRFALARNAGWVSERDRSASECNCFISRVLFQCSHLLSDGESAVLVDAREEMSCASGVRCHGWDFIGDKVDHCVEDSNV